MSKAVERLKTLLMDLAQLPGLSGMEQAVVWVMQDSLRPLADDVTVDPFGNVIATRHGNADGPCLMIAVHSDEVGGVVISILPEGFLRFQTVGKVNPAVLPGTRVRVANRLIGTVSSVPGHLVPEYEWGVVERPGALHIDIGAESEVQARAWGVREGASVVFESPLVVLENPRLVMGKAIDNRIGCAMLVATFEALAGESLPGTLYGVVNVLEEIGMRGARMTTSRLGPDYAIAVDTVPADDTPLSTAQGSMQFRIGGGPVIQLWEGKAEHFVGTVAHPRVTDLILDTAEAEGIAVQLSAAYGLWVTDAAAIHITGAGVPTGFVSVPRRYAHTPNELVDLADAEAGVRILAAIAGRTGGCFQPDFLADHD